MGMSIVPFRRLLVRQAGGQNGRFVVEVPDQRQPQGHPVHEAALQREGPDVR